tara:strand:+ start:70668 stop:71135 length:468 start_codon:yes stop_codon:yes gene_type:complete
VYEDFTDQAEKVMQLANTEALRLNYEHLDTENILAGLMKEGSGVAVNFLIKLDIDLRIIRLEVEKLVQSGLDCVTSVRLPLTLQAKKVIEFAREERLTLNDNYVGTEHLFLGIMREQDGVAAQVLVNRGLKLEECHEEFLNLLGAIARDWRTPEE